MIARTGKNGRNQTVKEHLAGVAELCSALLSLWRFPTAAEMGRLAGLLHDLGKYSDEFQRRISGEDIKVSHWEPGYRVLYDRLKPVARAIRAHHLGLQHDDDYQYDGIHPDPRTCLLRLCSDFGQLQSAVVPDRDWHSPAFRDMLATRIILGALCYADWTDSARFEGELPPDPLPIDWHVLLDNLYSLRQEKIGNAVCSPEMAQARDRVWEYARSLVDKQPGLHVLIAPTGTGKTFAMLRFALEHIIKHGLQRLIIATPFLSITDQWRELVEALIPEPRDQYLFVDHSMADDEGDTDSISYRIRKHYKAWLHPVVITTFNQLLESLFSNHPGQCRKLPHLARSVILLDEFHTVPPELFDLTYHALHYICEWGGTSVLMASATAPYRESVSVDLSGLDKPVENGLRNAAPVATIPPLRRFYTLNGLEPVSLSTLAEYVAEEHRQNPVAVVMNFTSDAAALATMLHTNMKVMHLSTRMCPLHRMKALEAIRQALRSGERFVLVSTQCIEAGVDLDFPVLFRALAPLPNIVQAAGRCNRSGNLQEGKVFLYRLDTDGEELKRLSRLSDHYARGARAVLAYLDDNWLRRVEDHDTLQTYLSRLAASVPVEWMEHIRLLDFDSVARLYRLIQIKPSDTVIIPRYLGEAGIDEETVRAGIKPAMIQRIRRASVDVFLRGKPAPGCSQLADGFWLLEDSSLYSDLIGLSLSRPEQDYFII